jgi:Membrane dipeptidase (Peptidase family M19)
VDPERAGSDEICLVAAAPSVTPWSVRRERGALREGGVDAVFATVASLEDTGGGGDPGGGVIGLCAFPSFISTAPRPSLDQLIDHAVHIAGLAGPGHAGLGLDFPDEGEEEYDFYGYDEKYYPRPPSAWPRGIEWLHQCRDISRALAARVFSPGEAAGVMGRNFLRVLTTIWGS